MDRREFLKTGAMLGGAAALGSRMPWAFAQGGGSGQGKVVPGTSILDGNAKDAPIDTIVVLMMENRSTDHYFGWLADDGPFNEFGQDTYGPSFKFRANSDQTYLDHETGDEVDTYYLAGPGSPVEHHYRGCGHPDPGHGWDHGRAQRDGGFLAEGSRNDIYALGYYQGSDLELYSQLARHFTTFDRYHCSLLAPTFPNREYMHSAQSGGLKGNALPPEVPGHETGFTWDTIWDRLQAAGMIPGVDAGYFFVDLPAILLWGARMLPFMQHIEEYFARAASGTLPKITFVDPGFTTGLRTDDHPYADIRAGQKLALDIVQAFVNSPQWDRGALFINYDEWGGFFDHVDPPILPDDRASTNDDENFGQTGFRTPTLMASPYALPGFVDGRLYDHTSILRFIEWRFLGAPPEGPEPGANGEHWWLTARDRFANNIGASLREAPTGAEADLPLLPEVPVTSAPCEGEELEGTFVDGIIHDAVDEVEEQIPEELEQHAFEKALHAGFYERMGYDVELKPLPTR